MIYTGQFKSIKDVLYTVKIETSTNAGNKELTLAGTPFVSDMSSDNDTIYSPVKSSVATCSILTNNYEFDIYSATPKGTKVTLTNNNTNTVEWIGYATPQLYDQGYTYETEEVQIECVDGLSVLQWIKYYSSEKKIISFLELLRKIFKESGVYTNFYISTSTQLYYSTSIHSVLDKLYISEQNFFKEKKDNETDNDVAWSMQEVLTEICRFLNVTAIAIGNEVWLIDYDALKNRHNSYHKYAVNSTSTSPTVINIGGVQNIQGSDHTSSDENLSLGEVYNKISIKAEAYTYDEIIPDFFDGATNITADSDSALATSNNVDEGMWGEVVSSDLSEIDHINRNMIALIDRTYNPQSKKYKGYNVVFVKYYTSPYIDLYNYSSAGTKISYPVTMNYSQTKTLTGSALARFYVAQMPDDFQFWKDIILVWKNGHISWQGISKDIDEVLAENNISSIAMSDYVCLFNPTGTTINNSNMNDKPMLQTKVRDLTSFFGGKNSYLILSGKMNFHYFTEDPYPIPAGQVDISEGRYALDAGQTYILAKLQIGNQFWDGEKWTTTDSTFKMKYCKDTATRKERRSDALMFKDNDFINTVSWRIGTTEKGLCIPMPVTEQLLAGYPILTLYKAYDANYHSDRSGDNKGQWYKLTRVFLKDLKIKAIVGDPTFEGMNESDTIYTNIINGNNVTDGPDISFKVCTYDNKNPSFSSVAYESGGDLFYVDKLYSKACAAGELSWSSSDVTAPNSRNGMRQEEHMLYRLSNQYSTPSVILNVNIRKELIKIYHLYTCTGLPGKQFICDTFRTDYRYNTVSVKLVEKK